MFSGRVPREQKSPPFLLESGVQRRCPAEMVNLVKFDDFVEKHVQKSTPTRPSRTCIESKKGPNSQRSHMFQCVCGPLICTVALVLIRHNLKAQASSLLLSSLELSDARAYAP